MFKINSEYSDLNKYIDEFKNIWYYKKNTNIIHNSYGPAFINRLYEVYYIENKIHRLDGPAIIHSNGLKYYFIDGKKLSKEEFDINKKRLKFLGKEYLICLG